MSVLEITSEIIVEISAIKIFTLYVLSLVTAFAENKRFSLKLLQLWTSRMLLTLNWIKYVKFCQNGVLIEVEIIWYNLKHLIRWITKTVQIFVVSPHCYAKENLIWLFCVSVIHFQTYFLLKLCWWIAMTSLLIYSTVAASLVMK